ncbi:Taxoid 2-alpha-hydroxylase [Linum grandiflorum]
MRSNTAAEKFLEQKIQKYGDISKLSLFGKPTLFIHGKAANKLVFTGIRIWNSQTMSMRSILGEKNLLELSGEEHKRVRGAMASFLKAGGTEKGLWRASSMVTSSATAWRKRYLTVEDENRTISSVVCFTPFLSFSFLLSSFSFTTAPPLTSILQITRI